MHLPLVIAAAPTGAWKTKRDHPGLPITPDEVARAAAASLDAGAAMLHLHVRDADDRHLLDADAYREAIRQVRAAVGDRLIIQATSEAAGRYEREHQIRVIRELQPEAASFAVREFFPEEGNEATAARFFAWVHEQRIMAQYIVYSAGDLRRFLDLRRRGVIPGDRASALFVLGHRGENGDADPADLLDFLETWQDETGPWMVCAFGRQEGACALAAATLGGHARVGFENNLRLADGSQARESHESVRQLADCAERAGRRIADAAEARRLFQG